LFGLWCKVYNCHLNEMDRPLEDFTCFTDFFTRPLLPGVRTIDPTPSAMVSPVDAKVVSLGNFRINRADLGRMNNIEITQVKGINYRFLDFVGQHPQGLDMSRPLIFSFVVLYLAPGDYHRFHSPAEWQATQRRHFPGHLVPLRERFAGMYQENERVVMNGTWEHGFFSMAAVGALNVGSIHMDCDNEIETNQGEGWFHRFPVATCHERQYDEPVAWARGDQVGKFSMGSTIVLVFQHPGDFEFDVNVGETVRLGQKLGATEA
jgi:phosphatidylserine decarboxylase